jgi:copper transport protein
VLAALLGLFLASPAAPASAHAELVSTNPRNGATLAGPPRQLALAFSEHVVLRSTRIEVVDGDGTAVPVTDLRLVTLDPEDGEQPATIVGRLPDLEPGDYRVSWQTLSGDDLHEESGVFTFGVGERVEAAGAVETLPGAGEVALRWLLLLGTALALGGFLARSVLASSVPEAGAVRRAGRLSFAGAATALLGTAALLAWQVSSGGLDARDLMAGTYALRWTVRESGLVLLALAAATVLRERSGELGRRSSRPLLLAGGALTCTGTALLGHAGAGALSVTRVLATAAHLAAALTWAGALICLVVLVHARRPGTPADVSWVAVLRAFALPASACVSVMVVTGLYLSSHVVASVDAAVSTFYGRTLLLKVTVAAVAGALALTNHRRLRVGQEPEPPRRTLLAEAAAVVMVVVATAVLTSAQPASVPGAGHPAPSLVGLLRIVAVLLALGVAGTWLVHARNRMSRTRLTAAGRPGRVSPALAAVARTYPARCLTAARRRRRAEPTTPRKTSMIGSASSGQENTANGLAEASAGELPAAARPGRSTR